MALRLINVTVAKSVLEISSSGALLGINGAADPTHILALSGNPIIKSTGVAYDNTVVSASAQAVSGTVTLDSSGSATITTNLGQAPVAADYGIDSLSTNSYTLRGPANTSLKYCYW